MLARSPERDGNDAPPCTEKREAAGGVGNSVMRMLRGSQGTSSSSTATATQQQEAPPHEVTLMLDRSSGSSLGVTFDSATFVISAVDCEGLAASWNASNPDKELRPGHRIVQVNGRTDALGMHERLQSQEPLEIKVAREVVCLDSEEKPQSASPCSSSTKNGSLKACVADVPSEEAPATNGSDKFRSKSVDKEEQDGVKSKDGDLVEMPSPSTHTSLMTNSLLAPAETISTPVNPARAATSPNANSEDPRSHSRTAELGAGDLATLREMAVEAATTKAGNAQGHSSSVGVPSMWSVSSMGSAPTVPQSAPPAESMMNGDGALQARSRSGAAPDEEGNNDIAPVHSSLSTTSPSLHQTLRQDRANPGSEALFSGMAVNSIAKTSNMLKEQLQMHGAGNAHASVGILGSGPFWTCGSTPNLRQHRCAATSSRTALGGILRGRGAPNAAAISSPFDFSSKISSILGSCTSVLSTAIDVSDEPEPPDDELTTVLLETKEQRLQWRDFLSEAVSKCRANALFASYDVEADPPRYARPPMSAPPQSSEKVDAMVRSYQQVGKTPPHVVAPCGAGFSQPTGSSQSGSASSGSALGKPQVPGSSSSTALPSSNSSARPGLQDLDHGVEVNSGVAPPPRDTADSRLFSTAKPHATTQSSSRSQANVEQRPPPAG